MIGEGETVVEHETARMRINGKELGFKIVLGFLCVLIFLLIAYPLYFIIIASFSDSTLVSTGKVIFIPKNVSFLVTRKFSRICGFGPGTEIRCFTRCSAPW